MTPLYIVTVDYGKQIGIGHVVVDERKDELLRMLISGEWDKVLNVYEWTPDEGTTRDVSEDLARDIGAKWEPLLPSVWEYCERQLGTRAANELEMETV